MVLFPIKAVLILMAVAVTLVITVLMIVDGAFDSLINLIDEV